MRKILFILLIITVNVGMLPSSNAFADSSGAAPGVVISAVQAGDAKSAKNEVVEIWNMSGETVDVTGWTLEYYPSTATPGSASSKLAAISADPGTRLLLAPNTREAIVSKDYKTQNPGFAKALEFSSQLTYDKTALVLKNAAGVTVDLVGWGSNQVFSGAPAPAMNDATALYRVNGNTSNNLHDFALATISSLMFVAGNLEEIEDICPNLSGIQPSLPDGYEIYNGECVVKFTPLALQITELLANPPGADAGKEFIELYNPTIFDTTLENYFLRIQGKNYALPKDELKAGSYYVVDAEAVGITLPNNEGVAVQLVARGNKLVSESSAYAAAPVNESWAWLMDECQYTNQPTPGSENMPNIYDEAESGKGTALAQCKAGWYRSPETGYCRKITVAENTVKPCKEGQYRSEETGRCRSIASAAAATLKPCGEGQFRNPETGRCKKIASADDVLQPCHEGYERNPETNRCRKIKDATVPGADFPVASVQQAATDSSGWWALGAVLAVAFGYAAWEWRHELVNGAKKLAGRRKHGK